MSDAKENMALLLQSETDFGLSILRQQNISESLVFSPLSIALALSLVHVAAKGETRDEIRNALVKGATDEQLEQHFANISAALLAAEKGTQVNIANHVFSKSGFDIKQSYLDEVKKLYNAGATPLDFNNQEASAEAINDFVRKNTGDHIKKIISPDAISPDLRAVLTNALYFKADWRNKFKPESTFDALFYTAEDVKRKIPFLRETAVNRQYAEDDEFQVLTLPYKDETFAMSIFLPKTRFGLSAALENLNAAKIQHLLSNTSNTMVTVKIPKWKIETALNLKEALQAVGIKKAFDQSADLGNMAEELFVSSVTHKALIEVDEDGTKAAAATTVSISLKSAFFPMEEPKNFIADHPFLFVLSNNNHPLFVGVHN